MFTRGNQQGGIIFCQMENLLIMLLSPESFLSNAFVARLSCEIICMFDAILR